MLPGGWTVPVGTAIEFGARDPALTHPQPKMLIVRNVGTTAVSLSGAPYVAGGQDFMLLAQQNVASLAPGR